MATMPTRYLVEQEFSPPLTDELHDVLAKRLEPCLMQYGVTWKASFLATDRTRMTCEFECDSAEQLRTALRSADIAFVRVWQARKHAAT
jgi:hypothetical protein